MQEKGGHTALHLACREGRRECTQQLLLAPPVAQRPREGSSFQAQLDCTNYDGRRCLGSVWRGVLEAGSQLSWPGFKWEANGFSSWLWGGEGRSGTQNCGLEMKDIINVTQLCF